MKPCNKAFRCIRLGQYQSSDDICRPLTLLCKPVITITTNEVLLNFLTLVNVEHTLSGSQWEALVDRAVGSSAMFAPLNSKLIDQFMTSILDSNSLTL